MSPTQLILGTALVAGTFHAVSTAAFARALTGTARESAGQFLINVENAELRHEYAREWSLLHPAQRAFISRSLFVRCFARRQNAQPRRIKALRTTSVLIMIPGVTTRRVPAKAVRIHIDYGSRAPSQTVTQRAISVHDRWYWITGAASTDAFKRLYFCK